MAYPFVPTPNQAYGPSLQSHSQHAANAALVQASAGASRALPRVDPWMYASYYNLPPLRSVQLIPHFNGIPPILDTFSASTVRSIYCSKKSKEFLAIRLYQALTAKVLGVYVNPSRARLDSVDGAFDYGVTYFRIPRRLHDPGLDQPLKNACFFTTGIVSYSHLFCPYVSASGNRTMEDRRIGVYPVEYEFQRGLGFFGTVSNKQFLRYSFCAGALHFVTRTKAITLDALRPVALKASWVCGIKEIKATQCTTFELNPFLTL